ncbi:MAG TPA: hypothetical protein PL182_04510 [Pseudobdellovibrionaceae bacterium]|nr:hypothetical protein [Pseudobdellovibrionaceae bacterium]
MYRVSLLLMSLSFLCSSAVIHHRIESLIPIPFPLFLGIYVLALGALAVTIHLSLKLAARGFAVASRAVRAFALQLRIFPALWSYLLKDNISLRFENRLMRLQMKALDTELKSVVKLWMKDSPKGDLFQENANVASSGPLLVPQRLRESILEADESVRRDRAVEFENQIKIDHLPAE